MKYYFFKSAPMPSGAAFNSGNVTQNLASVRIFAGSSFGITSLLLFSRIFVPYGRLLTKAAELNIITCFFFFTSAAALAGVYLIRFYRNLQQKHKLVRSFTFLYAWLFIVGCMAVSFVPQQNPKNNMTMYLLGALSVAVAWSLSLRETLLLMLLVSTTFTAGIYFSALDNEQLLLNSIGSAFILTCFFVLSRMIYSYRLNHFLQLQNIEAQKKEIQQISKAKSEILGVVAHDLRSPLANIEMLVSQVKKKKLSAQQEAYYLELVLSSCQRSRTLINDLVELARLEQEADFPLKKTDLNLFLKEVQAEWQRQLKGNRKLEMSLATGALYVNLNKGKFQRVMDNLLSNAIKFTPENGQIHISVTQPDENVLLRISDNGIGVPQKLQPHLFKPFSKAGRSGLNGEASTGLGLSISRKLVEQHNGTIDIESEENRGTTFLITLPALKEA
ncbi:sensor histidine kinase [Botryobacter ruber]|uniref:sensor histidine kinase n=1 Tax=Botryobacter ruber TaxID=2171629 RepID=UPI000FEC2F3E|nr:HAMP domain-containing sensor histidine kinase [Botryobacter ruber]